LPGRSANQHPARSSIQMTPAGIAGNAEKAPWRAFLHFLHFPQLSFGRNWVLRLGFGSTIGCRPFRSHRVGQSCAEQFGHAICRRLASGCSARSIPQPSAAPKGRRFSIPPGLARLALTLGNSLIRRSGHHLPTTTARVLTDFLTLDIAPACRKRRSCRQQPSAVEVIE